MTETKMLIGSLSNDLARVAAMIYGKSASAEIFFREMYRWINQLDVSTVKPYIQTILKNLKSHGQKPEYTQERAETYLMYSTILQNYILHME